MKPKVAKGVGPKIAEAIDTLNCCTSLVFGPLNQCRVRFKHLNTLIDWRGCVALSHMPEFGQMITFCMLCRKCLCQFLIAYVGNAATGNGAVALLDNMPSMDSTQVAQAKAQGAIILARGNMAEWAFTNAISIGSGSKPTQHNPCLAALHAIVHCGVLHVIMQIAYLPRQAEVHSSTLKATCISSFCMHLISSLPFKM